MSDEQKLKAAHSFFEAWNSGDLRKSTQYEADTMRSEAPGVTEPMTSEQNMKYNMNFMNAFPGSKFEILMDVVQGDYVVTNWRISGGNTGNLQAPSGGIIPATGKTATIVGSTTFQIKDGKIVHSWNYWDMSSLLGQLGLLPKM
jgi:steroid delta-isomerase-like uncharacterized protein